MSAYFVAQITINDFDEYQKYLDGYDEVFGKYQGEVVAVDDGPEVLEGSWSGTRIVLIRFPDDRELKRWYDSPEYRQLAVHRHNAATSDILLVHGRK